jgi:effector-binding domain-containing protein
LNGSAARKHASSLFQWAVVYGYLGLMEKLSAVISESPSNQQTKKGISKVMPNSASLCCSPPLWSPKLTLNLCLGNGHLKVLSHVLKQFPEMLRSYPDIDQFVFSLVATTESVDTILEISSYLHERDLFHLVFQTFMIGDVEIVHKLIEQGKTSLFTFTGEQCSEIILKCFRDGFEKKKTIGSAWQEELDQTLSQLRISEVTMKEVRKKETVEKNFTANKLEILKMVMDNDLFQKISMNQIVPSVGPVATYKFYIDNLKGSPVDFAFALCTSAKNQTDYEIFDYLFTSGKCHPNVKNRFGNGLVYTAFINGNSKLLTILLNAKADPNIYVNNNNDSLFNLALHSTFYLKQQGEGIKEELLLPCLKVLVQFKDIKYPPFNELLNFPCFLPSPLLLPIGVPLELADNDGMTILQRSINYNEDMSDVLNVINHPECTATVINYSATFDDSIPSYLPALALLLAFEERPSEEEDQFLVDALIKGGADVDEALRAIKKFDYSMSEEFSEEVAMKRIKPLLLKYTSTKSKTAKPSSSNSKSGAETTVAPSTGFSFSFGDSNFGVSSASKTEEKQSAFSFTIEDLEKSSKGINVTSGFTFGDSNTAFSFLGEKK